MLIMNKSFSNRGVAACTFFFFLFFSFLVPNHYQPWFNFYSEFLAVVGLFFFWALARKDDLVVGFPVYLIFALLLVVWVQYFLAIIHFAEIAWLVSFYLLSAVLAFMLGRQAGVVYFGAVGFLALGVISSGIALGQWFDTWETIWLLTSGAGERATANIGQPNHLVTLLGLGVVSALWLNLKRYISGWLLAVVTVWLVVGMVLAASRMALLQYFLIGVLWFYWCGIRTGLGIFAYLLGGLVLVLGAAWQADLAVALYLVEPGSIVGVYDRFASTERLHIWWQLIQASWGKGGLGYGWGQVAAAQVDYALVYPVEKFTLHAHNVVVDMLVWNGIYIGAVAVVLSGVWLVRKLWYVRDQDSAFAALCVAIIGVHALLEYPLEYSYFMIPFFIYLGYLGGEGCKVRLVPFWGATAFFGFFLLVMWRDYRVLETDFRNLRFEMARVGVAEYSSPDNSYFLLTGMSSFIDFMRMQLPGSLDEKAVEAERLVYSYPYVPAFYRYVLILVEQGDFGKAVEMLERMRSMHGDHRYAGALESLQRGAQNDSSLRAFLEYIESNK